VLYVADTAGTFGSVQILKYGTWENLGSISSGIVRPNSSWVARGSLYVANIGGANVTEYDSSGNLTFTYSAGMVEPTAVTTDRLGNVYETDNSGHVAVYAQGSNVAAATCSLPVDGVSARGVATGKQDNVFVSFTYPNGDAGIAVYRRRLKFCSVGTLPFTLRHAFGMAIDKQGNLVVAAGREVDIIAPPYTKITATLGSGWVLAVAVTIDGMGKKAFVTDVQRTEVQVVTYPGGSEVATLGSANGLSHPVSAVDSNNYAP
jgi:hypothetical protein